MKLPRRNFLHLAAGAAALPAFARIARAQAYPTRPVRVIVPVAAGGGSDIIARLMGQWLSERLGQPFVIENRPGGALNIGTEAVVKASPDGYTLLLATTTNTINATLYDKLNFNFIRDIAPVATISRYTWVMVVHPSFPAKTVPEFIAYAKANPRKINIASGGIGSASHVSGELFRMMTGVNLVHVPYRGQAPALADLLAAQVQVMFPAISSTIEYVRSGKLRALAVTTATRLDELPHIPTVAEFVPGLRGERLERLWFTQKHADRSHRQAQQGDQYRACRSENQGAACRPRDYTVCWLACRLRETHFRRNREVGQADPGGQHQA